MKALMKTTKMATPATVEKKWHLIDAEGLVVGRVASIKCVATACDEDMQLAMLVRREGESLVQLLTRLNTAIELAYERQHFIDEVNDGPDYSI